MAGRDVVFTILAIDHASASLARVGAEAETLGGTMGKSGRLVNHALNMMALAAAAVAVKSIELGAKFQSTMEMLHTQARVPQKDVDDLSGKVLDLAGAVGVGPESLAESLYHIESSFASTGITGKKAMDILRVASEGAKIGHADLVDVTNALDAAIASGIPGVQNFSQAMGALNAAVGAGDMHMQDMADAFSTGMVATVKGYGLSLRDVSAALATFGDNNMRGQLAGNQLRMSIMAMVMPIKGAEEWLGKLGLTTGSLGAALRHGGLEEGLGLLVQHLKDAGVSSKETGDFITHIFGRKAGTGLNILIDQFGRLKSKYGEIDKASGSFGKTWEDQQKLLQQQWDQLKSGAEALLTKIGLKLIPVVLDLGKKFGDLGNDIKPVVNFIEQHSTIFGSVAVAIGTLVAVMKTWQLVIKTVAVAQAALDVIMTANPIGLVIVAVAALTAGLIYAYKHSETFRDVVSAVWTALKTIVLTGVRIMVDAVLGFVGAILHAADSAFGWIPGIGPKLHSAAVGFDHFRDSVNAALDGISDRTVHVNIITHQEEITGKGGFHEGRASGGPVLAGRTYLVGERGPEIVTFGANGHVTNNADTHRALSSGGSGGGDTHVHIHMQSGFVGSTRELGVAMSEVLQRAKSQGVPINV